MGFEVKIRLEDIPAEGLELCLRDAGVRPRELGSQVGKIVAPPQASLRLRREGSMVLVTGHYQTRLHLVCSRCLAAVEVEVSGEVDTAFLPPLEDAPEEIRLQPEELEVGFYQEGEIDLALVVRQEVSLALPMAPLCRPECPGLCPHCGRPRAEGACSCAEQVVDPRWAKLAKLQLG